MVYPARPRRSQRKRQLVNSVGKIRRKSKHLLNFGGKKIGENICLFEYFFGGPQIRYSGVCKRVSCMEKLRQEGGGGLRLHEKLKLENVPFYYF